MLYNEHSKAGKELQRKIAKLREENKDPSLPQRLPSRNLASTSVNVTVPAINNSVATPQGAPSPPPHTGSKLSDSQQMVDESFMLLGQRVCHLTIGCHGQPCINFVGTCVQSETNDAFNHFWKITEGMLEHLSQPVAFATAPLAPPENGPSSSRRREGAGSSDTDIEDTFTKTINRGLDFVKAARSKMLVRNDSGTCTSDSDSGKPGINSFPPKPITDDWDEEFEADGTYLPSAYALYVRTECSR